MGLVVTMGSTATVTITPPARGHVVIDNPSAPAPVHHITVSLFAGSCAA
jgi:hypothetical protein